VSVFAGFMLGPGDPWGDALETYRGDGFSIGYPASWSPSEPPAEDPGVVFVAGAYGSGVTGSSMSIRLDKGAETAEEALLEYSMLYEVLGGESPEVEGAEVRGAQDAARAEIALPESLFNPVPARIVLASALLPSESTDKTFVTVAITVSEDEFGDLESTLDRVLDSFRMTEDR
jgi:hypothetical protein